MRPERVTQTISIRYFFIVAFLLGLSTASIGHAQALRTKVVASNLNAPVAAVAMPVEAGKRRVLVAEEKGRLKIVDLASGAGVLVGKVGEDLPGVKLRVLDMALHPDFAENRQAFISYHLNIEGTCFFSLVMVGIGEGYVESAPRIGRELLREKQGCSEAAGGGLSFAEGDILFVGFGVGREQIGDKAAQDTKRYNGKILRLSVDGGEPFGIPSDNPLVGKGGAEEAVWALGFRDPYRIRWDAQKKQLYVIDRGTGLLDEVNVVTRGSNHGWPMFEGRECQMMRFDCLGKRFVEPVFTNSGARGKHLTGGLVYRGGLASVTNRFLFAEQTQGTIYGIALSGGKEKTVKSAAGGEVSALFLGHDREVFVLSSARGQILELQ